MYQAFGPPLPPLRTRWREGKRTLKATLRAAWKMLKRDRGRAPLLALLFFVLPGFLLSLLQMQSLQRAVNAAYSPMNSLVYGQGNSSDMSLWLLDLVRSLVVTPLFLYAMARVFRRESLGALSPVKAVRDCFSDWKGALWLAFLCMIFTNILTILPSLLSSVLGLVLALFSWIPVVGSVLSIVGTIIVLLLQGFVGFLALCICYLVWMTWLERPQLRGFSLLMETIRRYREKIGVLLRFHLVCFVVYLLSLGTSLLAVYELLPLVPMLFLAPVLQAIALLLACAGTQCTLDAGGWTGPGGPRVHSNLSNDDLSHMKSAN